MGLERLKDPELIGRCLEGRHEAWEILVRRYQRLVYSVPIKMGLSREDTEEVFQETFVSLLRKLATVEKRERIGLWLAVTARRKALDLCARQRIDVPADEAHALVDHELLPDDQLLRLERQARVQQALALVPKRCRMLLDALFYQGLSYQEAARLLKTPVGSLGPTRRRCFEKLRVALERLKPGIKRREDDVS